MNMYQIECYFEDCVHYWTSTGVSRGVATVRAIWWDCVEVWNVEKSWTEEKVEFINRYRKYKPYDAIPDEEYISEGNA